MIDVGASGKISCQCDSNRKRTTQLRRGGAARGSAVRNVGDGGVADEYLGLT